MLPWASDDLLPDLGQQVAGRRLAIAHVWNIRSRMGRLDVFRQVYTQVSASHLHHQFHVRERLGGVYQADDP